MRIEAPTNPMLLVMKDCRGAAVIELGLALPVLLLLLVGMIDASRFVAATIDVEQAAQRTTDFALALRPADNNAAYLRNEAASAAGVSANNVTAEIYLECDDVRQSDFDTPCAAGQTSARFVNISITRNVDTYFDWAGFASLFGSQIFPEQVTVVGDSLVRFQ